MYLSPYKIFLAFCLTAISLVLWCSASEFELARELDYDAYRYLYNAVLGIDSTELGANYRIVDYLIFMGRLGFGIYPAHVLIAVLVLVYTFHVIPLPAKNIAFIPIGLISSFYLVQAGKDGFLAACLLVMPALVNKTSLSLFRKFNLFVLVIPISLLVLFSSWLRIQSIGFIILACIVSAKRIKLAVFIAIAMSLAYYLYLSYLGLDEALQDQLDSFIQQTAVPSSIAGVDLNEMTLASYLARVAMYVTAIIAAPFFYVYRQLSGSAPESINFVLAVMVIISFVPIVLRKRVRTSFLVSTLPFAFFLGASPVIHFRYIFATVPFCILNAFLSARSSRAGVKQCLT